MNCVFFGHRDAPDAIKVSLQSTLERLIDEGVNEFFVGNNGRFDLLVQTILEELCKKSSARYSIILSYINEHALNGKQENTIFPEGQELAPRHLAIVKRNEWLLKKADIIVSYVTHNASCSYKLLEKARKKGIRVINDWF